MSDDLRLCPSCTLEVPAAAAVCPRDGTPIDDPIGKTATVDPLIGEEVGEYQVKGRIGAGGMGIVYEGLQPVIGKKVALKVLQPELANNAEGMQRFLAEARAVNAIRHRGIIDIFNFGELPDGRHYLVMELLDGKPLDVLIADDGAMPAHFALPILDEILDALGAAHGAGVIHRDLKPSNVFVCTPPYGAKYVKLLDFGLAKQRSSRENEAKLTAASMVIGTPLYMAPEQAKSEPVTPMTDLYAFGILAFELLSGKPPFEAPTPLETVIMHVNAPRPRLSESVPDVPFELDELVLRLMHRDPKDRPQSAKAVRHELSRIRKELQGQATQGGAPRFDDRPTRNTLDDAPAAGALAGSGVSGGEHLLAPTAPSVKISHLTGAASPPQERLNETHVPLKPKVAHRPSATTAPELPAAAAVASVEPAPVRSVSRVSAPQGARLADAERDSSPRVPHVPRAGMTEAIGPVARSMDATRGGVARTNGPPRLEKTGAGIRPVSKVTKPAPKKSRRPIVAYGLGALALAAVSVAAGLYLRKRVFSPETQLQVHRPLPAPPSPVSDPVTDAPTAEATPADSPSPASVPPPVGLAGAGSPSVAEVLAKASSLQKRLDLLESAVGPRPEKRKFLEKILRRLHDSSDPRFLSQRMHELEEFERKQLR